MHFDLLTLYYLAVGTLVLSAILTLWERQAQPQRGRELAVLAGGYLVLATGCALATTRALLPDGIGAALSNIVMTGGYLIVLNGVTLWTGGRYRTASIGLLVAVSATWAIGGARWEAGLWSYVSAIPIALVTGVTALEVLSCEKLRAMRSRRVIVAVSGGHAVFYAARGILLPYLVTRFGPDALAIASQVTMYEGVLYSIGLPMALLALVREEAHDRVLNASRTDYLTGLANRRWFFEEGKRVCGSAQGRSIALLAFDLDHFKAINDRYGHDAGDEVLKLFAQAVRSKTGTAAVIARIGGGVRRAAARPRRPARTQGRAGNRIRIQQGGGAELAVLRPHRHRQHRRRRIRHRRDRTEQPSLRGRSRSVRSQDARTRPD